ncbi:hypothetical protein HK101_007853 [Irineochytrium annulatum]|nr:hypothetical protein HK101_007853 [Irineochytrium annulatum]
MKLRGLVANGGFEWQEDLIQWNDGCVAFESKDFYAAISSFEPVADTSRIHFNMSMCHHNLRNVDEAIGCLTKAIACDMYMAVAYFERGVCFFSKNMLPEALADYSDALAFLRGNLVIDYTQLGLAFKLYACEVSFNRGLCFAAIGQIDAALADFDDALRARPMTPASPESPNAASRSHGRIAEAIDLCERAPDYCRPFTVPLECLFKPPAGKVKNTKKVEYLGKSKVVAAADETDGFAGFSGAKLKADTLLRNKSQGPLEAENNFTIGRSAARGAQAPMGLDGTPISYASLNRRAQSATTNTPTPVRRGSNSDGPTAPSLPRGRSGSAGNVGQRTSSRIVGASPIPGREQQSQRRPSEPSPLTRSPSRGASYPSPPPNESDDDDNDDDAPYRRPAAQGGSRRRETEPDVMPSSSRAPRPEMSQAPPSPPRSRNTSPYGDRRPRSPSSSGGGRSRSRGGGGGGAGGNRSSSGDEERYGGGRGYNGSRDTMTTAISGTTSGFGDKVKVKCHLGEVVRIIAVPADIEFGTFSKRIQGKFGSDARLKLKYRDESGEMILVTDQEDLEIAFESGLTGDNGDRLELWCSRKRGVAFPILMPSYLAKHIGTVAAAAARRPTVVDTQAAAARPDAAPAGATLSDRAVTTSAAIASPPSTPSTDSSSSSSRLTSSESSVSSPLSTDSDSSASPTTADGDEIAEDDWVDLGGDLERKEEAEELAAALGEWEDVRAVVEAERRGRWGKRRMGKPLETRESM